jgi:hypothetical protein
MTKSRALFVSLFASTALAAVAGASDLTPAASAAAATAMQQTPPAAPSCSTGDTFCISTKDPNANPSIGQNANPLAPLTGVLPTQGIVAAGPATQGSGTPASYLFYDGNPTDMDPFGGYLGLNTADTKTAVLGIVFSGLRADNFNRAGGNNPLLSIGGLNESMRRLSGGAR